MISGLPVTPLPRRRPMEKSLMMLFPSNAFRAPISVFAFSVLCATAATAQTTTAVTNPSTTHGIAIANMDPSVKPGDNFYLYANGAWIKRTEIPADRPSIGVFSILADRSNQNVAAIIKDAAKSSAPAGSSKRKIADLYNAFMDESAIEARGMKPLEPHLAEIAAIHDRHDLAVALGKTLRADVDLLNNAVFSTSNLFGLWIAPGFSDSDHYIPYLLQGGLEMPSKSYYLDDSEHMKDARAKYATHVEAMLRLAGLDDPGSRAERVIALEHDIAQTHISLADIEDIAKANNLWTRADFTAKAPGLDWDAYFEAAGLARQQQFMVWTPTALTGESALVASAPIDTWKDWLAFHLIEQSASVLPHAVADEQFSFFGKVLTGVQRAAAALAARRRPRQRRPWRRGRGNLCAEIFFAASQSAGSGHGRQSHRCLPQTARRAHLACTFNAG